MKTLIASSLISLAQAIVARSAAEYPGCKGAVNGDLMSGIAGLVGEGQSDAPLRNIQDETGNLLNQGKRVLRNEQNLSPQYIDLALSNLDRLIPGLSRILNQSNTDTRTATAGDFAALAPILRGAMDSANPETAALRKRLTESASSGLDMGASLSPADIYHVTSPLRADWSNRGLGTSNMAQLDEAVKLATTGEGLRNSRQNFATGVANLGYAADQPLYQILSQLAGTQGATNAAALATVDRYGLEPNILDRFQGYAGGVNAGNQNARLNTNLFNAQATTDAWKQTGKGVDSAISSIAMGMCWAAREVYGAHDMRWLQFREWLLNEAPEKLRNWYRDNGQKWAQKLRTNPVARRVVMAWMDRRINRS